MSRYTVYITPQALREVRGLPGYVRQRVKRTIDELADCPYPPGSKELELPEERELRLWRIRLDRWRIVYAVHEPDRVVDVLAVRRRPPYDYGNLEELLAEIQP